MKARHRVNYAENSSSSRISSSDEAPPQDVCVPLHFSQDRVFENSQADPIEMAPLQLEANALFCSSPIPINCVPDFEETVPRIDSESSILPPTDSENDDKKCRGFPCSVENFPIQLWILLMSMRSRKKLSRQFSVFSRPLYRRIIIFPLLMQ